jgi:ATP-dependent DNA helicase RecQ
LFYARKDIYTALFLIRQSENEDEIARKRQLLNHIERYCETDGCLRRYMLRYFGESADDDCGNCGSCAGSYDEADVTVDAQKVLSHITRLNNLGKRFMYRRTTAILRGKSEDFTDLPTFGLMRGVPRQYILRLVRRLTALGYIDNGLFLAVTPKAREVLFNGATVTMRGGKPAAEPAGAVSEELLAKLKALRLAIAREEKLPAYIVFSDTTLADMCRKRPKTEAEMMNVSGVGQVKLRRYGERFLQVLRESED